MPLDAPVIACLAGEIQRKLPVKIDKIHQPFGDEFLISCFGMGDSFKLLLSLNSQFSRIHIFEGNRENPVNPSAFCMLLRKHFGGSKLVAVEAVPFERLVQMTFEVYDPIYGLSKKRIQLELTGKSANLIITNEAGQIIDAWRKTTPKPGEREIAAGVPYELPPTGNRWKPVTITERAFVALFSQLPPEVTIEKFLLKHWYGLSGLSVRLITEKADLDPELDCSGLSVPHQTALYQSFAAWADLTLQQAYRPVGLYDQLQQLVDCYAFDLTGTTLDTVGRPVANLNQTVTALFNHRHEQARFREAQQNLLRKLRQQLDKTRTKLQKQQAEAVQADQGDDFRVRGELLTTYGYQIAKGAANVQLANYYDPEANSLTITLNPALSAQENAQSYFKKYQKAKKGQLAIAEQIARTQDSLDYLESIEALLFAAESLADLRLVKEEMDLSENSRKIKPKKPSGRKEAPAEPRQYQTPTGHTLLVGRNNLQNDRLTFKVADPTDLWFHTQKIPGSHVILRLQPGTAVDEETLNYACQLAAYFSKAQRSTKIPVDYTQRKNVKKPPGAKPGFVIYDHFKSAIITPDPQILAELGVQINR